MTDPLKLAVATLAQRRNSEVMKREELKLTWCFDLRWVEPSQADRVILAAIDAGYLKEAPGGFMVTFPVDSLVIPTGFNPSLEELLTPLPLPVAKRSITPSSSSSRHSSAPPSIPSSSPASSSSSGVISTSSSKVSFIASSTPDPTPSEKITRSNSRAKVSGKVVQPGSIDGGEPIFPALIAAIQKRTGLPRREIISRINRSQKEHALTDIEVEGLLEAARQGLDLREFIEPTSRLLKGRYEGD